MNPHLHFHLYIHLLYLRVARALASGDGWSVGQAMSRHMHISVNMDVLQIL
jgi:hypothetical protein